MAMNTVSPLQADPLFVGATRPPLRWGVPYSALLFNLVLTMELFLLTRNLLMLLGAVPLHGLCALLCAREVRYFELLWLWSRTQGAGWLANRGFWQASSYSPLPLRRPYEHRQAGAGAPTVYL